MSTDQFLNPIHPRCRSVHPSGAHVCVISRSCCTAGSFYGPTCDRNDVAQHATRDGTWLFAVDVFAPGLIVAHPLKVECGQDEVVVCLFGMHCGMVGQISDGKSSVIRHNIHRLVFIDSHLLIGSLGFRQIIMSPWFHLGFRRSCAGDGDAVASDRIELVPWVDEGCMVSLFVILYSYSQVRGFVDSSELISASLSPLRRWFKSPPGDQVQDRTVPPVLP